MNISLPWPLSRFASGSTVNPVVDPTSNIRKPSSIASLLRFYETPGVPPPSSRVDPLLQQRGGHVMSLRDIISLGALLALKGESRKKPEDFHSDVTKWDTRRGHYASLGPFCLFSHAFSPLGSSFLATEVATDVVSHQIWGPRKKSWSLPMTILAGIMRNAGRHSNLVDIVRPRSTLSPLLTLAFRPPYDPSWDSAALYLYRRMRS
jgi:hypothetical protein